MALPSPMQSADWLLSWWQAYQSNSGNELCVLGVRDHTGRLTALMPLYTEQSWLGQSLHWMGSGAVCSDHAAIIVPHALNHDTVTVNGDIDSIVSPFLDPSIVEQMPVWNRLVLEDIDADDPLMATFIHRLKQSGFGLVQKQSGGTCTIPLPGSWEEYLSSLTKNHRKRCRRWVREFFDTGRATVTVNTTPQDCLNAYEVLTDLHRERRNNLGGTGAFDDEVFWSFHRDAIRALAARQGCELRLLQVDGETVAAEYVLVDSSGFYAYQSGLGRKGEAVSAGSLSLLAVIRDAIRRGMSRVDLLRGTEDYKFHWGAVHRPAKTLFCFPASISGRTIAAVGIAARNVKARIRGAVAGIR